MTMRSIIEIDYEQGTLVFYIPYPLHGLGRNAGRGFYRRGFIEKHAIPWHAAEAGGGVASFS